MKNIILVLASLFLVAACGPRDVAMGLNGKSVNNKGGKTTDPSTYIVVEKDGDLAETCTGSPFKTIDSPVEFDTQIFSGKVTASFQPGDRNCFRIGDVIDLQDRKGGPSRGKVKIKRAEIFHFSKLSNTQAKAFNTSLETLTARVRAEMDRVKAIPKGEPGGFDPREMLTVTYFEYLGKDGNGTTPATSTPVTDIIEISDNGTMSKTCPADFTPSKSIDIPEDKDNDIKSGKLIGFMKAGDQNCYQIGSTVSLKAKPKVKGETTPERAKLKIAWVEIVPLDKLNNDHAAILNMSESDLKVSAEQMVKSASFDAKNAVNITVFEYIP